MSIQQILEARGRTAPDAHALYAVDRAPLDHGTLGTLHFNISHSGEVALCGVADREIGVDVGQLKYHDDIERVARHFVSADEVRSLDALPMTDRAHFFFRTWVRKEAYVKATGEGLARDMASFTVREAGVTLHEPNTNDRTNKSYSVYDLPDIGDHFAAIALAETGTTPRIRYREWLT